jgi:hypothetical protein
MRVGFAAAKRHNALRVISLARRFGVSGKGRSRSSRAHHTTARLLLSDFNDRGRDISVAAGSN